MLFNRFKMKTKLVALSLFIGLSSLTAVGLLSITQSRKALLHANQDALTGIRTARQEQIESYLNFIHEQMFNFAQDRMITEAASKFIEAFHAVPEQVGLDANEGGEVYRSVMGYYTQQFKPRLEEANQPWRGDKTYIPASASGRILQSFYIANNPNPVGEKLNLDRADAECDYNTYHAIYHPRIRDYLQSFGYYDIFLFDLEGNLVYSVFKETDYATNFVSGPYRDTNFATVYRKARDASSPGAVVIEDFKHYEPSYGAGASFIGSPVFYEGKKIGVAIFQMPLDNINAIMGSGAGLGETGQTYLFGSDGLLRSNSRFSEDGETTILNQQTCQVAIDTAKTGEITNIIADDYRGESALMSVSPLHIEGLDWSIVAEEQLSEVYASANSLRNAILFGAAMIALVVTGIGVLFARSLTKPIQAMVERLKDIAEGEGDLTQRVDQDRADELGELGKWFNLFVQKIHEVISEVRDAAHEVAGASTQIAASSEEMAAGISEQNTQMMQISAAIEQMSTSVVEVAHKSVDAANNASESGRVAEEGGKVVAETIEGMNQINEAVSASAASVSELGKRGEQIGQIISVINDIADQTNLLALNAAIEAARAGEHGRGFAVVADEVRKLADRTTKATEEIGESITAIQTETSLAVERMTTGTEQVRVGVDKATMAGQRLEEIVTKAQDVAGMIQSIAAAAEQQTSASEQVSQGVQSVSEASCQSAQGANQAAQAAAQLSGKSEQLQMLVERFKL